MYHWALLHTLRDHEALGRVVAKELATGDESAPHEECWYSPVKACEAVLLGDAHQLPKQTPLWPRAALRLQSVFRLEERAAHRVREGPRAKASHEGSRRAPAQAGGRLDAAADRFVDPHADAKGTSKGGHPAGAAREPQAADQALRFQDLP